MELARTDYYTIERGTGAGIVSMIWTDRTEEMTDSDYKEGLSRLAGIANEYRSAAILVDVSKFRHEPGPLMGEWRDRNVVPAYNKAGVRKVAIVWGKGADVPAESEPPGPHEHFATRDFADREDARDWLLGYHTERISIPFTKKNLDNSGPQSS